MGHAKLITVRSETERDSFLGPTMGSTCIAVSFTSGYIQLLNRKTLSREKVSMQIKMF